MYLHRHIEKILKKAEKQTKVVLLTGPRQVGKSTSMKEIFPNYTYITLDDDDELALARNDRALFFRDRKFPVIIDEVQYEKELLRTIKKIVDERNEKGLVFITGSQTYELMSISAESLAGRISIIEMNTLSCRELYSSDFYESFVPSEEYLRKRKNALVPYPDIWVHIHRGFMPELLDDSRDYKWFYRDYIHTYVERDIRKTINIKDEIKFRNLLVSLAARSSQMLNYDDISKDAGIDVKTVKSWISVIAASGLIKIIHPYHNNAIKRAVKTPKLYFMETGLMCYLTGWYTSEAAKTGAMSGHIFETFVVSEIIKSHLNSGGDADNIFYYRDKDKKEIDLIIKDGNTLYPIEIKKGATINSEWGKNFGVLNKVTDHETADGIVLCLTDKIRPIAGNVRAVPIEYV